MVIHLEIKHSHCKKRKKHGENGISISYNMKHPKNNLYIVLTPLLRAVTQRMSDNRNSYKRISGEIFIGFGCPFGEMIYTTLCILNTVFLKLVTDQIIGYRRSCSNRYLIEQSSILNSKEHEYWRIFLKNRRFHYLQ